MSVLLTEKELCEYLSVSRPFLWGCRQQGMPYLLISSNSIRYNLDDVLAWFEERSCKSKAI